jgi:hypothetical protein
VRLGQQGIATGTGRHGQRLVDERQGLQGLARRLLASARPRAQDAIAVA